MNMATPPAAAAGSNPNPSSQLTSSDMIDGNEFMTLLTAELKDQDPTKPMDPTQFVSQLVQFNSLEQLISINQILTPASSSASGADAGADAPANS